MWDTKAAAECLQSLLSPLYWLEKIKAVSFPSAASDASSL